MFNFFYPEPRNNPEYKFFEYVSEINANFGMLSGLTSFTGGTVSGQTNFTNGLIANAISAGTLNITYIGSGTSVANLGIDVLGNVVYGSPGIYTTGFTYDSSNKFTISNSTGGTLSAVINTVTGLTVNGLLLSSSLSATSLSAGSIFSTTFSSNTISGGIINSGSTNLYNIFSKIEDLSRVQPGTNTYTGGTATAPTVNVSALTINTLTASGTTQLAAASATALSAGTLSGGTIYSGGTNLYNIFARIQDLSRVQPGTNTYTGGTEVAPTVNVSALTINTLTASGTTQLAAASATALSAGTLSGGTIYSGGTNLYNIFLNKLDDQRMLYNDSSTGLISFGGLSFVTSATTFEIGAIKGWFVNNTTDATNPTRQYVEFSASTGNTLTNLTGQNVTYIAVNSAGTVVQQALPFTSTQQRDNIHIGVVVHSNRSFINAVNNQPVVSLSPLSQLCDLIESMGVFNISGNTMSANGVNLSINKSYGQIFKEGVNFVNDNKNPHILTLAALTAPSNIRYRFQNGNETSNTAFIDPNTYDVNGTGTTVPDAKYTVQRIYLFQSNLIRIQYGQNIYDSLDDAKAGIIQSPFVTESNLIENGLLRGYLIVRKGTTNLTNFLDAIFIEASRFGLPSETNTGSGLFRGQILNDSSTGLISGGTMTILSSTGGTINITAGRGMVIDNTTAPTYPRLTEVEWSATTGVTITNLNTQPGTGIFVTTAGTFFQMNVLNLPSGSDIRDKIFLGVVGHPASALTMTFNVPLAIVSPLSQLNDLTSSIGPFSIAGNRIGRITGTLALTKTSGKSFMSNGNYQTDRTNPSVLTIAALSASTLSYVKQNGFIGAISSGISTSQYDNAGTLTSLPSNDFVAHRIWHQPSTNLLFFQYGQTTYSNLSSARAGFSSENFVVPSVLEYAAYLVAIIIVREGETNLDNSTRSEIIPQGKFAGTGAGSSGVDTLQSVYNNSTTPEILTDSTRGAVIIRNGGAGGSNVFQILNTGGTLTAFITGQGNLSGQSITAATYVSREFGPSTANSATTINLSTFDRFSYSLTSNTTFTFSNSFSGKSYTIGITQATASSGNTATFTAGTNTIKWQNSVTPVMTPTSGKTDIFTFTHLDGFIYGSYIQNF